MTAPNASSEMPGPSPDLGRKEGLFSVGAAAFGWQGFLLFDKLDGKRSVDGVVPAGCLSGWPFEEDNGIHVLKRVPGWLRLSTARAKEYEQS